jgi:hypothetical protein
MSYVFCLMVCRSTKPANWVLDETTYSKLILLLIDLQHILNFKKIWKFDNVIYFEMFALVL